MRGKRRLREGRVLERLGPDARDHLAVRRRVRCGQRDRVAAEAHLAVGELRFDEIHRRGADERGDEEVRRTRVELLRRVDLLDPPVPHDRHALAQRHRLDLVVRDVDRRRRQPPVERCQLGAHAHAELRVEVRERLVHEERLRLAHDRASHRDPLALAARERRGLAVEQLVEAEELGGTGDSLPDLALGGLAHLQPVAEVLAHGHVRVERVALEDHRDVAGARRQVGHVALADRDRAARYLLEAGDHPQQRRLAAARRPDEDEELAAADRERDVVDGDHAAGEDLADVVEDDLGHSRSWSLYRMRR